MAGGGENGAHDQRAMEEGRKEEYPAEQNCAMVSVPFVQKVRPPPSSPPMTAKDTVIDFLFSLMFTTPPALHLSFRDRCGVLCLTDLLYMNYC